MKRIYIKLIQMALILIVSITVVVSSSYAWMVLAGSPAVTGIQVAVGGGTTILIAPDVTETVEAYRRLSERVDYPLHVGVTEAGTAYNGIIRSSVGIGTLLMEGIGDTLRVSLTADPVEEIHAGIAILKAVGLRRDGVRVISCPTCGRTQIDLIPLANEVEKALSHVKKSLTVAVMGCVVNGPGEAREADYGIAGGKDEGLLFRKGLVIGKVPADKLCAALLDLIESDE